jgi:hypothetical protein
MYLSNYVPFYLCIYVPIYLCTYLSTYLCIYLSIYLTYVSIYLCTYLSTHIYIAIVLCTNLFIYLSIYLSIYVPIYISMYLSWCHRKTWTASLGQLHSPCAAAAPRPAQRSDSTFRNQSGVKLISWWDKLVSTNIARKIILKYDSYRTLLSKLLSYLSKIYYSMTSFN